MRCYICDRSLDEVHFNSDHGDIEPCESCLIVIKETVEGFKDNPYADEDAFGEEWQFSAFPEDIFGPDDDYA